MRTQVSPLLVGVGVVLLLCGTTLLPHPATAQTTPPGAGGWTRLKDVKDYHVVGMAEFAVAEHNKRTGQDLQYVRIIRGQVDGTSYRLIIQANDHMRKHRYEAVVWEKLWDKIRELVSFRLLA